MVLDYSKFDNIELSDDSDIEVHPNVDKRSFIKWKQRDIHEKRERAKMQMQHYKIEIDMNKALIAKIDQLMAALKEKSADTPSSVIASVLQSYSAEDRKGSGAGPSFLEMIEALLKQVDTEVKSIRDEDKSSAIAHKVSMHRDKLLGIITKRQGEIKQLEQENEKKITSDGLREGFNYSSVKNIEPEAPIKPSILKTHPPKERKRKEVIETLNPGSVSTAQATDAGYESDSDMEGENLPAHIEPTPLGREFGKIAIGNYDESLQFIGKHPNIIRDETETDGLLIDAYYAEVRGESGKAKQYVHQGLLLQFCRQLGRDGVSMFFRRIKDKSHRATQLFNQELESTYAKIKLRADEAPAESTTDEPQVEQIQLHAVNPGTKIAISIPPAGHSDPEIQEAREIFDNFKSDLKAALETGKLEEINKVLGDMPVEEGEAVVEQLSRGGMLAIEEEILDATQPGFKLPDRAVPPEKIDDGYMEEDIDPPKQISAVDDID